MIKSILAATYIGLILALLPRYLVNKIRTLYVKRGEINAKE